MNSARFVVPGHEDMFSEAFSYVDEKPIRVTYGCNVFNLNHDETQRVLELLKRADEWFLANKSNHPSGTTAGVCDVYHNEDDGDIDD